MKRFLFRFGITSLAMCTGLHAADVYSSKVVAITGDNVSGVSLVGMGDSPSINFAGVAAFVGQFSTGEGVVVGNGINSPALISQAPQLNRFFGRAVQIADSNRVIATDRVVGSPQLYFVRNWDANASNSFVTIAQSNGSTLFDAVFAFGSLNKGGGAVFAGLKKNGPDTLLATAQTGSGTINTPITMPPNSVARPMISDSGTVVVKFGFGATDPLRLYSFDLLTFVTIADSGDFLELGNAPGISEDGRIITFYGDVTPTGAAKYGSGRGIFASVDIEGSRRIFRLTGILVESTSAPGGDDDGVCEAGEVCIPAPEAGHTATKFSGFVFNIQSERSCARDVSIEGCGGRRRRHVCCILHGHSERSRHKSRYIGAARNLDCSR